MVVFDATMLMLAVRPESGRPIDPTTGKPVEHVRERIDFLIGELGKSKAKIGIPTPALSEVLVRSGNGAKNLVSKINEFSVFQILMFDEISAIEVALMTRSSIDAGDKKDGSLEVWNKIKYDRQIVAIARVNQAAAIYTDDTGLRNTAQRVGIPVVGLADMLLPPAKAQIEIAFPEPGPIEVDDAEALAEIDDAARVETAGGESV